MAGMGLADALVTLLLACIIAKVQVEVWTLAIAPLT